MPDPRTWSRRALLRTGGAALAAATGGCLTSTPRSQTTSEPTAETRTATATPAPPTVPATTSVGDAEVTLRSPRHRHALYWLQADASRGEVRGFPDGEQGLFVSASVDGDTAPDPSAFAVSAGGERYVGTVAPLGSQGYRFYNLGASYHTEEPNGWLCFTLPCPLDATDPALTVSRGEETARVTLSQNVVDALGRPAPAFELVSFDAPDSVETGSAFEITAAVHNHGGPGTFRAAVNPSGAHAAGVFRLRVPPGETRSGTFRVPERVTGDGSGWSGQVALAGPCVSASATVDRQ